MSKSNAHKSSSPYPEWNVKKFEEKLEKEVKHRKNLISYSTNTFDTTNNESPKKSTFDLDEANGGMLLDSSGIYKQFLLIGIPPTVENSQDPNVKPTVLIAYPPFEYPKMPVKKIIEHCMPTGHRRDFLSRNSNSPIQDEFVFQFGGSLGSEDKPIYGVCVHVSTKDTSPPFFGSKKDKDRVFCFCLMTKMPVFSVHFSFLTCLALWTVGHVRHLHKYDNLIRVNLTPGEPIEDLDLVDQIGHHPSITVPVSFQNEIASYFISKVSSTPEKLSRASNTFMKGYVDKKIEKMNNKHHNFRYEPEDCSIELKFPPEKDIYENSICWASLDTLFSVLTPTDILTIISGLLLDRQVLIIGSRLQEVSMAVWALMSIIRPFKFAGTIIPILPTTSEDYLGLLQLPTPFLFGVPRCNELKSVTFLETAVFVDLDKQNVPPIENLPPYPNAKYVDSELTKFLYSAKGSHELNEYSFPSIYLKTLKHKYSFPPSSCAKVNEIISSPFQSSIYGNYICGFFVTDMSASPEGVTVFNEELFLSQVHSMLNDNPDDLYGQSLPPSGREKTKDKEKRLKEEMEFWNNIVESQTFQMYIEERMQDFMEVKYRTLLNTNKQSSSNNNMNTKSNDEDEDESTTKNDTDSDSSENEEKKSTKNQENDKTGHSKIKTKSSSTNKINKEARSKRNKNKSNDQNNEVEIPKSLPIKIGVNRNRKVQISNPKRIKSLKNVLFDLPSNNPSNLALDNQNDDHVKSDGEKDEGSNEKNMTLSGSKLKKSSTVTILKTNFFSDENENEEDEEIEVKKKPVKRKSYPRPVRHHDDDGGYEEEDDNDNYEKVKIPSSRQTKTKIDKNRRRSSSKKIERDTENSEENDENAKKRRSSSNAEKSDNDKSRSSSKKRKNSNKSDSDDQIDIQSTRRRSSSTANKSDTDSDNEKEPTKRRRKTYSNAEKSDNDNQPKRRKSIPNGEIETVKNRNSQKKRKTSSTDNKSDTDEEENQPKRRKSSSSVKKVDTENDNIRNKSQRKRKSNENAPKKTEKSKKPPQPRPSKNSIKNDDFEEDDENIRSSKSRRKSTQNRKSVNLDNDEQIEKNPSHKNKRTSNEIDKKSKSKNKAEPVKKIQRKTSNPVLSKDDGKKKKIQLQDDSSSDYEDSYSESSDSFNPNVFYKNEELDRSTTSDED